jgi:hypothetical protein
VQDQGIGRRRPLLPGYRGAELRFDGLGIVTFRDANPVRHAEHMSIDRQARHAEGMPEHDVRRLAADTRQLRQRIHVGGDVAPMPFDDGRRHTVERLRLRAEESRRLDLRLELVGRRRGERLCVRVALEQRRRDLVHTLVGALRREDRRHQQFVRRGEMQLGVRVRMLLLELPHDRAGLGRRVHGTIVGDSFAPPTFFSRARRSLPRSPDP